ncbi:amidase [Ligilactobacillus sp. WILCCON 0076]|uniref:Amidase n=1 Tax=Ligilactobacillus ubinensis TaxID=2876789 RepID=A0A9X2FK69_9LACO|nr:amidase family protein [Ligilactobacillus ubinensis]MCP0885843.1 amidase [Ligilactobacillus ubinensis]
MVADATYWADQLRLGRVSFEEMIQMLQRKIANLNPQLNALVSFNPVVGKNTYQQMLDVNDQLFAGLPVPTKILSQAATGLPVTAATKLFKDVVAKEDTNFIKQVKKIGLVPMATTNAPEFGFKNVTDSVLYGNACNPWNLAHTPGGSSGGAAAAVAAGIFPLALASDGGGSIRIPASFNGLVGLKPTRGTIPVGPDSWRSWQGAAIDFALTISMRDTKRLFYGLRSQADTAPYQAPQTEWMHFLDDDFSTRPLRVAINTKSPVGTPVDAAAVAAVEKAASFLQLELGCEIKEDTPKIAGHASMETYYAMNGAETAAMFDEIAQKIGRTVTQKDVEPLTWALNQYGQRLSAKSYIQTLNAWDTAADKVDSFFTQYDLYLTPTTAQTAPKLAARTENIVPELLAPQDISIEENAAMIYEMFEPSLAVTPFTQLANLTGNPALSLPIAISKKMPLGVQLMAAKGREDVLFEVGHAFEEAGMFKLPPFYNGIVN